MNKIEFLGSSILTCFFHDPRRGNRKEKMQIAYKSSASSCMKGSSSRTSAASKGTVWIVPNHFAHSNWENANLLNQEKVCSDFAQALQFSYIETSKMKYTMQLSLHDNQVHSNGVKIRTFCTDQSLLPITQSKSCKETENMWYGQVTHSCKEECL